jgi:DNA invertase Pin-like site-specific DNA recombinase
MVYAYLRVSTKEQNLDRQIDEVRKSGIHIDRECHEMQSGKDFKSRRVYQKLKKRLTWGDTLVICSIDRLGRNYEEILKEWKEITNKGVDIQVLDMPILNTKNGVEGLDGKFISNLVLQILAYVAQKEREKIKERQRQGIDSAMAKGVRFGRPKKELPENYELVVEQYRNHEITNMQAVKMLGISRANFFRLLKQ